ncbi:hypothetical protein ACS0TY_001713 [Phlomoides rotata]
MVNSTNRSFRNNNVDMRMQEKHALLAPTQDVVGSINEYKVLLNTIEATTYLSFDSAYKYDSNVDILVVAHTPEFLNGLSCFQVQNHKLTLTIETPIILLRNIDHLIRLCKGWLRQRLLTTFLKEKF